MIGWLSGTLLATTLLMVLVLAVREPVRKQFGPAAAYGLWLIPALRMLMPPLTQTVERVLPAAQPLVFRPATTTVAADPSLLDRLGGLESLLLSGWVAGAALMLAGGILMYRWQRREVLRDGVQLAKLDKIRILQSPAVSGPMAFGILDKVIALPIDFEDRFSPEERRLAFDHELSHHQAGDLILSHLAFGFLCLQWFNPIAWLSHAAFRFDQEAACDGRVLDKANAGNRAAYAQAITKAASGRALLFAGALDRPRTLHRRLASMLSSPSTGRRIAGKALIALTAAAALPLTASHATEYVDVPARPATPGPAQASAPAAATVVSTTSLAAGAATASGPVLMQQNSDGTVTLSGNVRVGPDSTAFFDDDTVLINGKRKTLDQLTAAERSKLRAVILDSQQDLVRERARLPRELAEAKREADRARSGELRREHLRDIEDMRRDLAEVDSEASEMRAGGEDPARRKAEILRDLHEAQAEDIAREEREAIMEDNPAKRIADLRSEEQQMTRMLARLDQLDRR
jgi:beta-lactamase regulating signal transducer with metallopeptidase domain